MTAAKNDIAAKRHKTYKKYGPGDGKGVSHYDS